MSEYSIANSVLTGRTASTNITGKNVQIAIRISEESSKSYASQESKSTVEFEPSRPKPESKHTRRHAVNAWRREPTFFSQLTELKKQESASKEPVIEFKERKTETPAPLRPALSRGWSLIRIIKKAAFANRAFSDTRLQKCVSTSPRFLTPMFENSSLLETESIAWQRCFKAMGGLEKVGDTEEEQTEDLQTHPFHCDMPGKQFEVRLGTLALDHSLMNKFEESRRSIQAPVVDKYAPKQAYLLPLSIKYEKPLDVNQLVLYGDEDEPRYYFPQSMVKVHWVDDQRIRYNLPTIFEWLSNTFGQILFCIKIREKTYLFCFSRMKDAAAAAMYKKMGAKKVYITWCNTNCYNMCYLKNYWNYEVQKDPHWLHSVNKQRLVGMRTLLDPDPPKPENAYQKYEYSKTEEKLVAAALPLIYNFPHF